MSLDSKTEALDSETEENSNNNAINGDVKRLSMT